MSWKKVAYLDEVATLSDVDPVDVKKQTADPGTATEAARQDHKHNLDLSASGLDELGVPTGPVDMNSQRVTSVGTPTTVGDAIPADADIRAPDATLLEGSTKTEVQDHVPKTHATSHEDGGGDELTLDSLGEPVAAVEINKQSILNPVIDPQATEPPSPTNYQIYTNTTDKHLYVYVPA